MVRRLLAAGLLLASCARAPRELDVAAAISLSDALAEVARGWEAGGGEHVVFDFAGSNVLARQIRAGAPVDVFLSAGVRTMASIRGELEPPVPLLANTLVVMSNHPMTSLRDLSPLKVAIGDPSAVPAGVYAQQALQRAGVRPAIVPCENVRAALAAAESGGAGRLLFPVGRGDARLHRERISSSVFQNRGYDFDTTCSSLIVTPPRARPAIAKAMAMRWSLCVSTVTGSLPHPGSMRSESGRSSTRPPRRRRSSVTVAMRSDSLTRKFATLTISTGSLASGAIAASVGTRSGVALQSNVPPRRTFPVTVVPSTMQPMSCRMSRKRASPCALGSARPFT